MTVEQLLSKVGDTGRYHWIILCLFSTVWLNVVFNNVIMTFYGFAPPPPAQAAACSAALRQPPEAGNAASVQPSPTDVTTAGDCNASAALNSSWIRTVESISVVTEWQLYDDRKWMLSLATSMYFAGVMIGGLVMGSLADVVGRKKVLLTCLVAPIPLGVAVYFNPYYEGFVALRFCIGIFVQGLSGVGFVNCVEFFSARHKLRVILGFEATWVLGMMLLALIAFLLSEDWRQLQLAISLVPAVALAYIWWLPESPRWLSVKKRHSELRHVAEKIVRVNGAKVDIGDLCLEATQPTQNERVDIVRRHFSLIDMFRTPLIRRRSIALFYIWFTVSAGYYALTFGMPPLLPNRFINFFVLACCELVGLSINGLALAKVGRKIPLIVSLVGSGVTCATAGFLATHVASSEAVSGVTTSMALIGRTCVTVSYQTLFIWTSELFPTVIRGLAVGACGFCMRLGSLVAPQLLLLGDYTWPELPIVILGVMCLAGGGLTFLLPETKDMNLPDSIEDVESPMTRRPGETEKQLLASPHATSDTPLVQDSASSRL